MSLLSAPPPRVVDAGAAVLCATAMVLELVYGPDKGNEVTLAALVAIAVASAPVLGCRRWPVWAFGLALLALFGILSTTHLYNTLAFPSVVCGYALASQRGRRHAAVAAAVTLPLVVVILQTYSPHPLLSWDTGKNLGLVALPLALGVATYDRRASRIALEQRAESAERSREEEALRRVGQERLRIARDVHDVVAHAMVAINVQAGVGAHLLERDPAQARSTLREIKRLSGDALGDLRAMLGVLRAGEAGSGTTGPDAVPVHPTLGLGQVDELADGLRTAGVDLALDIDPGPALPAPVDATGYRIVQEALTNVMRHSGPTSVRVSVRRRDSCVLIEVEDDGAAGQAALVGAGSGNGLRGMRERATALGGTLEAGPRSEGGWRVAAALPVGAGR